MLTRRMMMVKKGQYWEDVTSRVTIALYGSVTRYINWYNTSNTNVTGDPPKICTTFLPVNENEKYRITWNAVKNTGSASATLYGVSNFNTLVTSHSASNLTKVSALGGGSKTTKSVEYTITKTFSAEAPQIYLFAIANYIGDNKIDGLKIEKWVE